MTAITEEQLKGVESKLNGMASTVRKEELVARLIKDIRYSLKHIDETEYGIDLIHNLAVATGVLDGEYNKIEDGIVRNTQRVLLHRIASLQSSRRLRDADCTDIKDTVLPGSNWVYRGWCAFVRRCKHDFTIHFKCGKRGNVPHYEEVAEQMKELIEESEE